MDIFVRLKWKFLNVEIFGIFFFQNIRKNVYIFVHFQKGNFPGNIWMKTVILCF